MLKKIATSFLFCYLLIGISGGLLLSSAIPALNWVGVMFYALTWPSYTFCTLTGAGCWTLSEALPAWLLQLMFTF